MHITCINEGWWRAAGQPIVYPRNDLNYSENFLNMLFSVPSEKYVADPEMVRAMEVILVLHMDHEQNASTSTVRTAGMLQLQIAGMCLELYVQLDFLILRSS